MKRNLRQLPLYAVLLAVLALAAGCDEPNTADLPPQPYRLQAAYHGPSAITDVEVAGNTGVVGFEHTGYNVLNLTNLGAISVIDSYRVLTPGARCRAVAIDTLNSLVAAVLPADAADPNPVRDYRTHRRVSGISASGAAEAAFVSRADTAYLWLTDNVGDNRLKADSWIQLNDTTWDWEFVQYQWNSPVSDSKVQYFAEQPGGDLIALAWEAGVLLFDCVTGMAVDTLELPGRSKDCAWHGNYIFVAAELEMLVLEVQNQTMELVQRFSIDGADRLRQIEVDGSHAILLDGTDGLYMVEIGNPTAPKLVQKVSLPEPVEIATSGGRLYAADRMEGLLIYTR